MGVWIRQTTEHTPANLGLLPDRFSRRATRLDPREVLGVDRLRWTSGRHTYPRRDARQRDALLAARNSGIFCALILGKHGKLSFNGNRPHYHSGGLLDFSKGDFPHIPALGQRRGMPTSSTSTKLRKAATSPPSNSRRHSCARCAPASK